MAVYSAAAKKQPLILHLSKAGRKEHAPCIKKNKEKKEC
jgi:hypothetical protein